jgi:hypothetical protein
VNFITLRHTHTIDRTSQDELSARRRDLYVTTHNTHKRQRSMPPAGSKPAIPAKRTATDPRLRPRGHRDRQSLTHGPLFLSKIMANYVTHCLHVIIISIKFVQFCQPLVWLLTDHKEFYRGKSVIGSLMFGYLATM